MVGGAFAGPPPVMRTSPSAIASSRPELRASASEKVLRFAIVLRRPSEFSATSLSKRRISSRAACMTSCPALGSAMSSGGARSVPASGAAVGAPPINATAGEPIRPCV